MPKLLVGLRGLQLLLEDKHDYIITVCFCLCLSLDGHSMLCTLLAYLSSRKVAKPACRWHSSCSSVGSVDHERSHFRQTIELTLCFSPDNRSLAILELLRSVTPRKHQSWYAIG